MKTWSCKIIGLAFLTGYLYIPALSQQSPFNNPVAVAVSKGIWVYLGNYIPKDGYYQVERKQSGSNTYEVLGKVQAPATRQELESRQQQITYFDKLDILNAMEIEKIWRYFQRHTANDSLVSGNLPVMHLVIGTAFFDTKPENGRSYTYRISFQRNNGSSVQTTETKPVSWPVMTALPVAEFIGKNYSSSQLMLTWYIKEKKEMSSFNVYRSVFGKNEFHKVPVRKGFTMKRDSLLLIAVDSIGNTPSYYEYTLEPVDIYGNAGETGGLCSGGAIEDHYVSPVKELSAVSLSSDHTVKLRWKHDNKKYINSITVMRSSHYDSGYARIINLSPTDTTYIDYVPVAGENYYYYLLLNSAEPVPQKTARVSILYKGKDQKPVAPSPIAAETIKGGIRISWKYNEPFTKGFYVYRQGNSNEPFRQVSNFIRTGQDIYSYTDTSQTLMGNNVYQYVVKSVTDNDLFSDPSDTVYAKPGKAAYVVSPMHLRYNIDGNRVSLSWDNMARTQPGLLGYKVYRRKQEEKNFIPVQDDPLQFASVNFFTDSQYIVGMKYEYAVSAIDMFGNESALSLPVTVTVPVKLPAAPTGIKTELDESGILIRWAQQGSTEAEQYSVYRTEKGRARKKIGVVSAEQTEFLDKEISKGVLYFYEITVSDKRQKESGFSEKIAVRYR